MTLEQAENTFTSSTPGNTFKARSSLASQLAAQKASAGQDTPEMEFANTDVKFGRAPTTLDQERLTKSAGPSAAQSFEG